MYQNYEVATYESGILQDPSCLVLDAERTQLETQDQLAQARTEAATTYADLYGALGGSWPTAGGESPKN